MRHYFCTNRWLNSSAPKWGWVLDQRRNQNLPSHGNTQSHEEVPKMKRFGILLIVAMLGLVLACGCSEEKKAPVKSATPPAKAEKPVTPAPPATPPPAAPAQPKPEHPK
jgi:hypothetical protein